MIVRERAIRVLAVSVIFAGPLVAGSLSFWLQAPGREPGIYLETINHSVLRPGEIFGGQYALTASQDHSLTTVATRTIVPFVPRSPARAFVIVGTPDSAMMANAPSAELWCFVVNASNERVGDMVPMPIEVRQINPRILSPAAKVTGGMASVEAPRPRAFRVTSDELAKASRWDSASIAFRQYRRAATGTTPASAFSVMVGLAIQESATGAPHLYAVRVGPPR